MSPGSTARSDRTTGASQDRVARRSVLKSCAVESDAWSLPSTTIRASGVSVSDPSADVHDASAGMTDGVGEAAEAVEVATLMVASRSTDANSMVEIFMTRDIHEKLARYCRGVNGSRAGGFVGG